MMNRRGCTIEKIIWISLIFPLTLLSGCNFSLAADVTPPPGYQMELSSIPETNTPPPPLFPLLQPDVMNGKKIFLEQCAECHGNRGLGDGSRSQKLPNPPAPIGSFQLVSQAVPAKWFNVVSQGNMGKNMPAFPGLTDRQRWDVIAYVLSLSLSEPQLELGKSIFIEQCAGCHGEDGRGSGELAENMQPQNLTQLDFQASRANVDFLILFGMAVQ